MPRENRKRGKKHKKVHEEEPQYTQEYVEPIEEPRGEPSWIVPASGQTEEVNPEAPFGYVDADVKAYFRTVDVQIRNWQDNRDETATDGDVDPNEHKRMFFTAALQEMQKKEKQLATDPDCSVILERMSYSMDDFVRRVFVDSLAGSYDVLVRHRFASHVCQTLFTVARDTISREAKGITPAIPVSEEEGELRTLSQLVLDICEELLPNFSSLVMDPFASHVVRSLLLLLSPNLSASEENSQSAVRSKKSAAWKARQGQMKSVFSEDKGKGKETLRSTPPEFRQMARRFVQMVRDQLDENETRAMAANKVSCPGLQMLLEVEADQDMSNESNSLMDRVMAGVITTCKSNPCADIEESDYLGTLLRDPNSSHLLEIIVSRCPDDAFNALWKTYFKGKLARLAAHPVANFVLAKALESVSESQLSGLFEELDGTWNKLIRTSRTGVLRAVVDRVSTLKLSGQQIIEAVYAAFNLETAEDKRLIVPCALTLLPVAEYRAAVASQSSKPADDPSSHHGNRHGHAPAPQDPLEPKTQGSILLQSLLRLPEALNAFITDSINSLPIEERIKISHNAAGSRIFDELLDSPTILPKVKRQFVMDFIGHYHVLVDDKLGSRVGDRCWAFADTYLKEKIARSLVNQEQALAASYYGKFFARNLNLYLLQRRPEDWRNLQSERKRAQDQEKLQTAAPPPAKHEPAAQPESRKRKSHPENEIDALFNEKLGKRIKKAALSESAGTTDVSSDAHPVKKEKNGDKDLQQVLGAIRSAPANDGKKKKKH
ncbi:armadillo-type protein [Pholiota molesta]|nr:armadillo-type protein [Pholiota molesta]